MSINVTHSSMLSFEEYCEEIKSIWDPVWLKNEKVDNNIFSYETGVKAAKEIQIKILK